MSDTQDLCVHELQRAQCGLCRPQSRQFWDALYQSSCDACGRDIQPGDRVTWNIEKTKTIHARHGRT